MKYVILLLLSVSFISQSLAFRGGGGFRGGGMGVGVGVGSSGMGPRGNVGVGVGVGVGVHGARGSVYAHRSAPMGAYYHPYSYNYWGWYGYAPYHYYYLPTVSYTVIEEVETKPAEKGAITHEIPSNCKSEIVNGKSYKHCGVNWFEPKYSGTELEYVVVDPPK